MNDINTSNSIPYKEIFAHHDDISVPIAQPAILKVKIGDAVNSGQTLTIGQQAANTLSPISGIVSNIEKKILATPQMESAMCITLSHTHNTPPASFATPPASFVTHPASFSSEKKDTLPILLKKQGIVGLGGSAFPAWKKWRKNIKIFIANAMESDEKLHCDASLLEQEKENIIKKVNTAGRAFAPNVILALREDYLPHLSHPMIRRLPHHYASGNERLLINALTGHNIPAHYPPADFGIITFNIATVCAIADCLLNQTPLYRRIITIHINEHHYINVQAAFGTTLKTIRQQLDIKNKLYTSNNSPLPDDAVIAASSNYLYCYKPKPVSSEPCIRCGYCLPVCPTKLSPWRIYQLIDTQRFDELENERLSHCLLCRRCDDVCPSHLPLTHSFNIGKQYLHHEKQQSALKDERSKRYEKHQQRIKHRQEKKWLNVNNIKNSIQSIFNHSDKS